MRARVVCGRNRSAGVGRLHGQPKSSMAPMSVSATLAPLPKATARSSARRAPSVAAVAAGSTALLAVTPVAHAAALSKEDVAGSLTKVVDTVDQVIGVGGKVAEQSAGVLKALGEAVKPVLPVLKSASEEALKLAAPVVSGASKQATEALQGAGVDPAPVLSAAKTAAEQSTKVIDAAKPVASAAVETITSLAPGDYVVAAGAAFVAYLLLPPVWSLVSFSLRDYRGDLTPAQALDMVSTQDYVLIDVRSNKDKAKAGVPQLPSNAKNKLISVPLEELPRQLKGMVRNAKKAEAEITALKISYLKRIGKGSNVIIMDSYNDNSKIVAKTLNSVGFKNCWAMAGGFSGRKGWAQSRLGTDSYNLSVVEVVTPSRVIPAAAGRIGTTSSASRAPTRMLLPGSVD
ncbi:calcium sensing receptor, chloroplastic-like [Phragmites australis]|uniref:calcium sensing receptor, chloroplastic-like n=1 Tax=Phragmites australis TaxID=29695 RepID=UPI002D797721|nr:calcium sensing receptor, chloroplastic-like [Phragmites australis]